MPVVRGLVLALGFMALGETPSQAQSAKGRLVEREFTSRHFDHNKVGSSPVRKMVVYLPPGYDGSTRRYPTIYFLPSDFDGSFRAAFDTQDAQGLFDRAIASGSIEGFILVCVDMRTPFGSSWYVNSPVTGDWEDCMVDELVPDIDANFRTLAKSDSRGVAGVGMGGYGAIRFGMKHPDVFGSVYGLHPVGTGSGVRVMDSLPDWDLLANAKSKDDLKASGVSWIFTTIFQAHLPNPDKPPLFIDLPARKSAGRLVIDAKLTERLRNSFFLESMIPQYADNLKSLRGLKFDWDRSDPNHDHVFSNRALTHKLNEFGIVHEAEEYNGAWGESNWGDSGRIATDVLPFFRRHLAFEPRDESSR
ncbi:alpha/beta hydrolase [Singulisphaera sp. PoT]|uniref:alpha/beta hydrolase n=1 Tax=Singulisphaera sp. PoT TaxID=3411797 RepID=UPI003BF5B701